ncbi:HNH endonuclease [Ralstonia solanacearum]|uniref:HNH endonuclease signature motif containing protein n=1 Tax=Ralstonia pseudosolanacearum TaxID=1310165 RepID=UPI0009C0B493|nr:HNH endonuclease signature motif containing protein [Ralstonia pseudosolanacearum]AZU56728.1 HNH endonuclease [Ralstonia solanacearum]MCK4119783.1 HNH endonuclease [Ralstonia pseudosolanacearum]QIK22932.1 HNH endonuclease [Ralstonia solanacearum]QIK29029.1 HNH endonuclease [Ralstonia solanacearum]QIK33937.1 HNH endonuclease [Ralstonia solanacearum]
MVRHKGRQRRPLAERFWENVDKRGPDECWPWIGSIDTRGYESIGADGGKPLMRAHRVAYELCVAPIPDGMVACHRCDNRACVNPGHIFIATQRENILDMVRKGRRQWPKGEHHPKAKLRASEVLAIREDPRPPRLICAQYGIGRTTLYQIKRRETWGCLA